MRSISTIKLRQNNKETQRMAAKQMQPVYYSKRGTVESVKSREGEISIKKYIAFPKSVTRCFGYGPSHSVTQTVTRSSLEGGHDFMFSLVSAAPLSEMFGHSCPLS